MDPKLLFENGWKAIAAKNKLKDNGLQKSLAGYENLAPDEHDERLKSIAAISQLAGVLKKTKEITALPDVAKYLANLVSAAESAKTEIGKARVQAEKLQAETKKREDQEKQQDQQGADDAEEQGDYKTKLAAAFQKLKGAKDLSYQFIVCDAKPHCALMIAKKIGPQHKAELTKITDGSKRFLHLGTCQFQDGKFVFSMDQPVSGLARKLQDSIKNFIGKKLPLKVGDESAGDGQDDSPSALSANAHASPVAANPNLAKAPEVWHKTLDAVSTSIENLKRAARTEFANEAPETLAEVEEIVLRFDGVLAKIDRSLADLLTKAHSAKDPAARQAELKKAQDTLKDYIVHVTNDQLIAHIDSNPFGVNTKVRQTLAASLKHIAGVISEPARPA